MAILLLQPSEWGLEVLAITPNFLESQNHTHRHVCDDCIYVPVCLHMCVGASGGHQVPCPGALYLISWARVIHRT